MSKTCSGTQASDRFGIVLDFVTKLQKGAITDVEVKRFLRRENPFNKNEEAPKTDEPWPVPLLILSHCWQETDFPSIGDMRTTEECFTGSLWSNSKYREGRLRKLFPKDQRSSGACTLTGFDCSRDCLPTEAIANILNIDKGVRIPNSHLCELLITGGYTVTLPQIERLVEMDHRGKRRNGISREEGNVFFARTYNPENPIVGCFVGYYEEDRWTIRSLDFKDNRFCRSGSRFFFRGDYWPTIKL